MQWRELCIPGKVLERRGIKRKDTETLIGVPLMSVAEYQAVRVHGLNIQCAPEVMKTSGKDLSNLMLTKHALSWVNKYSPLKDVGNHLF